MSVNSIITIGIDSSSSFCGFAIYENGKFQGSILKKFPGSYDLDKLSQITKEVSEMFSQYVPSIVLIEEPVPVRSSRAVTCLNQVAGAICAVGFMHDAHVEFVHNRMVKSLMNVTSKEDSIQRAKAIYPHLGDVSDHESDAILVVESYMVKNNIK